MPTKSTPMSKSTSTQLVKSTAAAAQFQRMVKAFAASAPPGHHESTPVQTLCTVERAFSSGFSQTVALMQAGDQQFVQTITGNERFLPPSMRPSQKRGREVDDAEEEAVEEATPKKSKGKSKSANTTPAARRTRRSAQEDLTTPLNDDDEDPSPRASAGRPRAPRKSRAHRDRHAHNDEYNMDDDDDANLTETESTIASVLGLGPNVGVRRSTRHRTASEPLAKRVAVKPEPSEDDLLSLCGGFECIDVQSSIDAESEYGTPAPPVASTSTLRSGSVRA